jgi:Tol biopolymer transport system component
LDRLIARCLRKDVERRLQHAGDIRIALQEFAVDARVAARAQSVSGVSPAVPAPVPSQVSAHAVSAPCVAPPATCPAPVETRPSKRRRWPIVTAAIVVAGGVVGGGLYWDRRPPSNPFANAELFRLTSDTGLAVTPALSRDGRLVAYASDRANQAGLQIWVQQLSGGTPIQLTSGDADNTEPSFSPDGQLVAFRSERDGGGVYVVPALGGEARLIARQGRGARFSPDGKKIAYSTDGAGTTGRIFLVDLKGDPKPQPFHPEFMMARSPLWSPDGQSIFFVGVREPPPANASGATRQTDWWIAPVAGGPAEATGGYAVIRDNHFVPQDPGAWLPGNHLLLSAVRESAASLWLLDLPRPGRKLPYPTRLTFGTNTDQDPTFSGDSPAGFQVAFASIEKRTDIWELPVDANRGVVKGPLKRLTEGRGSESTQLTATADGKRIAFLSDRGGPNQPWIRDMTTGRQVSVSGGAGMFWQPHISPDGKSLAWGVFENGAVTRTRRARVEPDGQIGLAEPLCDQCGPISSWSPDGRRVVYSHGNPNRAAVFEIDTGRKYDVLVAPKMDVWGGRFSPDGKWLTMNVTPPDRPSRLYVARFDPERREPVPFDDWIPLTGGEAWDDKSRWSPDANSMYFVSERDGYRCIWRQPLDPQSKRPAGPPAAVMHFHEARLSLRNVGMGPLAMVVAGDRLIFSLGERTGNIWLLKRPRTE